MREEASYVVNTCLLDSVKNPYTFILVQISSKVSKRVQKMFVTPNTRKRTRAAAKKKQVQPEPPPKKPDKKLPEGRKYAQIAPESVKIKGESVGIEDLDDSVAKALCEEVSYRLREIIAKCTIYMRQTKCTKLTKAHLKSVYTANDLEYTLGHLTQPKFYLVEEADVYVLDDPIEELEEAVLVRPKEELEQLQMTIRGKIVLPDKELKPAAPNKKTSNESESVEGKTVPPDKQSKPAVLNKKSISETEPLEALGLRKVAKS